MSGKGPGVWDFSYRRIARSGEADLERELASVLGVFVLSYLPKFSPLKKRKRKQIEYNSLNPLSMVVFSTVEAGRQPCLKVYLGLRGTWRVSGHKAGEVFEEQDKLDVVWAATKGMSDFSLRLYL